MALFECPRCGTKLTYGGKEHPCKGGKSSGSTTAATSGVRQEDGADRLSLPVKSSGAARGDDARETAKLIAGKPPRPEINSAGKRPKSSDGGVESRHAKEGLGSDPDRAGVHRVNRDLNQSLAGVAPSPSEANSSSAPGSSAPQHAERLPKGDPAGPGAETKLERSSVGEPAAHNGLVAGSIPAAPTKRSRGRPKIDGPRPWEAEGISKAKYYRRRAEQKTK